MTSLRAGISPLRGCARAPAAQWQPWQPLQRPRSFRALLVAPSSINPTTTRSQTTLSKSNDITSIDHGDTKTSTIAHVRPLPISPAYFTRQERFMDLYVKIQEYFRKYQSLPRAPPERVPKVSWQKLEDYKTNTGEPVRAIDYSRCMDMVKHLHKTHPDIKPPFLDAALGPFMRSIHPFTNTPKPIPVDQWGRAVATGRRKTSVARAWVVEGTGEVQVNGKPLSEAFGRVHDRESATWALRATERVDKYNVWALVSGGGTTGQAEAMTLAVAKALMAHEPALKPALRRAGCVTRDPRMVERKKPGHLKARKMPAWVRR